LVSGPGVAVNQLRPPAVDPQLELSVNKAEEEVFRSTVAQILASVEKYAGANTFSTVNAMLQAATEQLALAQKCAERAEMLAFFQNFEWIKFTKIPLIAYRTQATPENPKGQEIAVDEDAFDTEFLYLKVDLKANTITDEQMRVNNEVNAVERLGKAEEVAWDNLGWEGHALNRIKKGEDLLYQATIQAEAQSILNRPQIELAEAQAAIQVKTQQAVLQMQQQAMQQGQEQAPENTASSTASPAFETTKGVDNRGGGMSTTPPGMGREQVNG
jgi:hypothetical protein